MSTSPQPCTNGECARCEVYQSITWFGGTLMFLSPHPTTCSESSTNTSTHLTTRKSWHLHHGIGFALTKVATNVNRLNHLNDKFIYNTIKLLN